MNNAHNVALSFLVAQHESEQRAAMPVLVVARPKKVAPIPQPVVTKKAGTLDAKGFMKAMLHAGRRLSDNGIPFTNQVEMRNDEIKAIESYVGYDYGGDFGSQEIAARTKAKRELSGRPIQGPTREESRAASRSLSGYVAGVPDTIQRKLGDLKGREQAAIDSMIGHEKDAADLARPEADRLLSSGLADVERERIQQIREDIDALT